MRWTRALGGTFSVVLGCTSGINGSDEAPISDLLFHLTPEGPEVRESPPEIRRIRAPSASETLARGFAYETDPKGNLLLVTQDDDIVCLDRTSGTSMRLAASGAREWYPKASPDGAWVLFESDRASFRDLYKVRWQGGEPVQLTNNPEGNFDGAWSPDGRRIVFASSRHRQLDVFIMNADGSAQTRLTRHRGDSVKPSFSPSGRWIAFISARDGQDDLYVIRTDGANLHKVSPERVPRGAKDARPGPSVERFHWHPTDDRLAFHARPSSGRKRRGTVYVARVPGGPLERISPEEADDREPAWSPAGSHLALASFGEIVVARADGSSRTKLTQTGGRAWLPRWLTPKKP